MTKIRTSHLNGLIEGAARSSLWVAGDADVGWLHL